MVAIITLLVLLFSECGAQIQCSQSELETENQLRELRAMVLELRGKLTGTQKELRDTTTALHDTNTALAAVKASNAARDTRLVATERVVEQVKRDTAAQHADLTSVKTNVAKLKYEFTEKPKVAFSAGLTNSGTVKAGNTDLNLVFTKIITNVGQAYSSTTGFFNAPVRGVYYIRFTVMDHLAGRIMYIKMYKNGEQVMFLGEYDTDGHSSYLSSGATLQLEVGDVVNMRLPAGYRLYDDSGNHNTFSGFLLFPL
ncbi:complement C1q tumor necrosis factor-related protein 3-like [Alosa sapidissima]|uniref:complement C1q tumor necrosis factor-related protein 3-like n=1 Tax=Alosa sapidissima TaxID=34773 RepID=UPI001C08ACBB|nr:complement C1q tumor necrosis factor-related protein 3-like [Alosa sapidissima]